MCREGGRIGRREREAVARAARLYEAARSPADDHARAVEAVRAALQPIQDAAVEQALDAIPVARLQDATGGRPRLGSVDKSGLHTVRQALYRWHGCRTPRAAGRGWAASARADCTPCGRRSTPVRTEFTAVSGPAVLLAQIQAAGVGLNLQAASVVIICEPQITPAIEQQAVARAHRMGQVRPVRVHRLLAPGGVDERMVEMLRRKARLFDAYARRSAVAEATPDAVDVTDTEMAHRIVAEEQARLGFETGDAGGEADDMGDDTGSDSGGADNESGESPNDRPRAGPDEVADGRSSPSGPAGRHPAQGPPESVPPRAAANRRLRDAG
ncbi:hypothetical protein M878_39570 [Streptomyces roseochromogenus subsp. oscitans DS 12.976]|uniref:Helicase C-terminal domain-containing protein n=2 Tax=Streptomyces roseochromogenus TaxID=285450 RepID=V6JKX1_STRRC|nr:hypothetical protein M878_39570 [Streptomyces roseochromogenus subsp. oscitans DS 12.976]